MSEIDSMDMLGFLGVRAWNARKEKKKKEPRRAFIDEGQPYAHCIRQVRNLE